LSLKETNVEGIIKFGLKNVNKYKSPIVLLIIKFIILINLLLFKVIKPTQPYILVVVENKNLSQ